MVNADSIKKKIEDRIKNSDVIVADLTGNSSNFAVDVISKEFEGKTKIQQHRMIYAALGDEMKDIIHALQIKTSAPS